MTTRSSNPAEVFMGLRARLFSEDLATLAPAQDNATRRDGPEVYGVAMEGGLTGGSYLVYGLRDGSASLYLSSGGGSLGGQGRPFINSAARAFVATAARVASTLPIVTEFPLPPAERVRFSIFTAAGIRAAEVDQRELMSGKSALEPLFRAGHEIITGFRMVQQDERPDEPSYLNCLLVALARGTATSSVTLDAEGPLPDPAKLTNNERDVEWIARIGFDFGTLSKTKIIQRLEDQAGFKALMFWQRERKLKVALAGPGGSRSSVTFVVRRTGDGNRRTLEISVQR